jgi:UV DNA damage endonuclease
MALRWGLCCLFVQEPVRFRTVTAKTLSSLGTEERRRRLGEIALHNAENLLLAVETCLRLGIGAFRISSDLLPLKTHPHYRYALKDLPGGTEAQALIEAAGALAARQGLRLSFHPDQFVVLNSPRPEVVAAAKEDLRYHLELAEITGADVINIHGGGVYGDFSGALDRLRHALDGLPEGLRRRLTLENDDRSYSPARLLPVCESAGIPFVYDAHHHRCLPDGLSAEDVTRRAFATWDREPLFHISSPAKGWKTGADPKPHNDYLDPPDVPALWFEEARSRDLTVDVEAKAKERAVLRAAELTGTGLLRRDGGPV